MILYAEILAVGVCRNVQHVFDPVVAIGNLELVPVESVILEAAAPVEAKAEEIKVKAVFGVHIFYNEAGVKYSDEPRVAEPRVINRIKETLNEGNGIALRIANLE